MSCTRSGEELKDELCARSHLTCEEGVEYGTSSSYRSTAVDESQTSLFTREKPIRANKQIPSQL